MDKLTLVSAFAGALVLTTGCVNHDPTVTLKTDPFGPGHLSHILPFRADRYVVKAGSLEYTPNVIRIHGNWLELKWHEEGRYLNNDVWIPIDSISAIEEIHD